MSHISWDVDKIIWDDNQDIRLHKKYFEKMTGGLFGLKKLMKPRRNIYVWKLDRDSDFLVPKKVRSLDLDNDRIIVREKDGRDGRVSFSSAYKPKNVKDVEEMIRNPTSATEPSYNHQETQQPDIFQDQPISAEM
jgi:hypothetical protein